MTPRIRAPRIRGKCWACGPVVVHPSGDRGRDRMRPRRIARSRSAALILSQNDPVPFEVWEIDAAEARRLTAEGVDYMTLTVAEVARQHDLSRGGITRAVARLSEDINVCTLTEREALCQSGQNGEVSPTRNPEDLQ